MGYLEIAKRAIEEMEASNKAQDTIRDGQVPATKKTNKTKKGPSMPPGVTLIHWEPKPAPVILSRLTVVNDVAEYVRATLDELDVALHQQHDTMAIRECIDQLEECGVIVEVPGIGGGR